MSVSAKDKATGKTQHIKIEFSSGLSDEEIEKMKADAKANEESDKKKKDVADVRNAADQTIFQTEKLIKDLEDKLDPSDKEKLQTGVDKLKELLKGDDIETIKMATEEHNKVWHEISEKMQKAAGGEPGQEGAAGFDPSQHQPKGEPQADAKEDVENADFEVVDDDEEKK